MDKVTLEKIVKAAIKLVDESGGISYSLSGPIAATLVSKAIESPQVRIALIGE